eukprot:COSAG01_NODE_8530_length_2751_cov_6.408748_1_plen_186_part_10
MPFANPGAHEHWYVSTDTPNDALPDSPHTAPFRHGLLAHSSASKIDAGIPEHGQALVLLGLCGPGVLLSHLTERGRAVTIGAACPGHLGAPGHVAVQPRARAPLGDVACDACAVALVEHHADERVVAQVVRPQAPASVQQGNRVIDLRHGVGVILVLCNQNQGFLSGQEFGRGMENYYPPKYECIP